MNMTGFSISTGNDYHITSGAIFDADTRNTSAVIQRLAELTTVEDLLNPVTGLTCAHCDKPFRRQDNFHIASDGEDVCTACCDSCSPSDKNLAVAICSIFAHSDGAENATAD